MRFALRHVAALAGVMLLAACASQKVAEAPKPPQAATVAPSSPSYLPPAPPPAAATESPAVLTPGTAMPSQPQTAIVGGTNRVALLVPLSGRDAALGRALLDAAELAVFDFGADNFTLMPFDTEATGAKSAADRAIDAGAQLIIGPLYARQVAEVASSAASRGINVIAFSNDRTVAGPNAYVFGLPPSEAIERVVAYARTQGIDKFAGLLPDDAYGMRLSDTLRTTVTAGGGTIVHLDSYPAGTNDFNNSVRRIAEFDARVVHDVAKVEETAGRTNDAKRRAAKMETTRPVDYDALLVAESGQRLRNMSALMAYYDIDTPKIRLIGPSTWEDPSLGREPGLVGGWFAAPDPALRANFEAHFKDAYGHAAPRLVTLAYDATGLAAVLARHDGPADYSARTLKDPSGFAGVDGIFRFTDQGVVERGLAVMEIQPRGLGTIVPAPTSFEPPTQ